MGPGTAEAAVATYEPLITSLAHRFSDGDPDLFQDLAQEGRVAVLESHAEARQPKYVVNRITWAIARYAHKEGRERDHLCLDDIIPTNGEDPEKAALRALALARANLTDRQAQALIRVITNEDPSGADRRVAYTARQKIRAAANR
jgi:hypothetical protein